VVFRDQFGDHPPARSRVKFGAAINSKVEIDGYCL
jgi:hypothetical protein